jgi:hypothetical protein
VPEVKVNMLFNDKLAPSFNSTDPPKLIENAAAVAAVVQIPEPELASKITASVANGGPKPLAPPEVFDQLVVLALSQVPVPPIQ